MGIYQNNSERVPRDVHMRSLSHPIHESSYTHAHWSHGFCKLLTGWPLDVHFLPLQDRVVCLHCYIVWNFCQYLNYCCVYVLCMLYMHVCVCVVCVCVVCACVVCACMCVCVVCACVHVCACVLCVHVCGVCMCVVCACMCVCVVCVVCACMWCVNVCCVCMCGVCCVYVCACVCLIVNFITPQS